MKCNVILNKIFDVTSLGLAFSRFIWLFHEIISSRLKTFKSYIHLVQLAFIAVSVQIFDESLGVVLYQPYDVWPNADFDLSKVDMAAIRLSFSTYTFKHFHLASSSEP